MAKTTVAKVVEIVGSSPKSWADAADTAVKISSKTIKNITGVQVHQMTASVKNGKIDLYKCTVKIAFGVKS
ncbi:MAG: dodecin domain-containing protein [bacterium]|nr:dodecin domain-containing protein [bacterium]